MNSIFNTPFLILIISFIFSFQSCSILDPCSNKESFLHHLDGIISEVKENGEKYSDEEWQEMDKKVEKIMDECYEKYKDDLSRDEKKKILSYATTYVIKRQKKNVEDFKEMIEDLELDRRAKEFFQEADEELKDLFNEVLKEDLEEVIDSALDEFEKLAKDLKEAWKENKEK